MSSATSPHIFKYADENDINFIDKELERNKYAIFIRKIAYEFPDEILRYYIYENNKENDETLVLVEPREMIYNKYKTSLFILSIIVLFYIVSLIMM